MRIRAFLKVARLNDHSNLVKNVYCLFGNGLYRRRLFKEQTIATDSICRRMGATNIVDSPFSWLRLFCKRWLRRHATIAG